MTATPATPLSIYGGTDTHADTIHVAVIDSLGRELGDREFPTSRAGYQDALKFLTGFGHVEVFGIEGTSSYGAGLARTATDAGLVVVEVNRPDRAHRRRRGKSDPIDAYQAAFAALCGTAPVPASSGKTTRHRLSRGGDRAANDALHTIALVRLASDPRTRQWATRQRARGRTGLDLLRVLKRAIAREIFRYLTQTITVPEIADLRPLRQSKNITVTAAANHFGVWPTLISNLERGIRRNDELANTYRKWLLAA